MHHRLAAIARPRPDQDPQVLTGDFLTKSLETTDDTDLTTHLTKMNSEFLKTVISELSLDSIVRELNSSVTQQDQILGVASDLNAVIRSAMRWEAFLNQAETLSAELDELPADGSNVEQAEGLLKQYNIARANGLKAQAKTRELAAKLKTQFSSLKSGN